jgi:hypothetical protein
VLEGLPCTRKRINASVHARPPLSSRTSSDKPASQTPLTAPATSSPYDIDPDTPFGSRAAEDERRRDMEAGHHAATRRIQKR